MKPRNNRPYNWGSERLEAYGESSHRLKHQKRRLAEVVDRYQKAEQRTRELTEERVKAVATGKKGYLVGAGGFTLAALIAPWDSRIAGCLALAGAAGVAVAARSLFVAHSQIYQERRAVAAAAANDLNSKMDLLQRDLAYLDSEQKRLEKQVGREFGLGTDREGALVEVGFSEGELEIGDFRLDWNV